MWLQAVSRADQFEEDEDTLCVVCLDKLREVIFYNCMHMVRSCTLRTTVCLVHVIPLSSACPRNNVV